jgi:hypothetical protein
LIAYQHPAVEFQNDVAGKRSRVIASLILLQIQSESLAAFGRLSKLFLMMIAVDPPIGHKSKCQSPNTLVSKLAGTYQKCALLQTQVPNGQKASALSKKFAEENDMRRLLPHGMVLADEWSICDRYH